MVTDTAPRQYADTGAMRNGDLWPSEAIPLVNETLSANEMPEAACKSRNGGEIWLTTGTSLSSPKLGADNEHGSSEEWHVECYRQG
jgi:hypothetical protein